MPLFPPTPSFPPTPAVRGSMRWPEMPAASPSTLACGGSVRQMVHNTFIHAMLPPTTPMRCSRRRAQSVPKALGSHRDDWETSCHELIFLNQPIKKSDCPASAETTEGSSSEWESDQRSSTVASEIAARSPLPCAEETPEKVALDQRRPQFRPAAPLTLGDSVISSPEPAVGKMWSNMSLTPAKLSRRGPVGRFVRNTFIHATVPPTPSPSSACRGQSIPRNFGSEKIVWEAANTPTWFRENSSAYLPHRAEPRTPQATHTPAPRTPHGVTTPFRSPALRQPQWSPTPLMSPEFCQWSPKFETPEFPNLCPHRNHQSKGPVLRLSDLL